MPRPGGREAPTGTVRIRQSRRCSQIQEIEEILGKLDDLTKWANEIQAYALDAALNHGKEWSRLETGRRPFQSQVQPMKTPWHDGCQYRLGTLTSTGNPCYPSRRWKSSWASKPSSISSEALLSNRPANLPWYPCIGQTSGNQYREVRLR